jgi:enamine deaminase RidA (YjgF/YER057c/UK114 family)
MSREYFVSNPAMPFSDAVLVDGKTLYLSGRIGLIPGTTKVPDTAEEEARLVLDEIKRVLAMAGMTMDHLVSLQIFCSDVSLFDQFNAVYRTYFTGKLPTRAFLGSGTLLFGARFELQGIAVKDA